MKIELHEFVACALGYDAVGRNWNVVAADIGAIPLQKLDLRAFADWCQVERDVTTLGRQCGLDVIAVERPLWLHAVAEQSEIDVVAVEQSELGIVVVGRQLGFEMVAVE